MSASFRLDFASNYIWIQYPANYEITLESQHQLWEALGEACRKYNCHRVLAECPTQLSRNMKRGDAIRLAMQAAKVSHDLRMACVYPGYKTDEATEFFITIAYKAGVRIEFFAAREDAFKWLGIDGERESRQSTLSLERPKQVRSRP